MEQDNFLSKGRPRGTCSYNNQRLAFCGPRFILHNPQGALIIAVLGWIHLYISFSIWCRCIYNAYFIRYFFRRRLFDFKLSTIVGSARGRFLRLCCSPKRNPHLLCSFHRTPADIMCMQHSPKASSSQKRMKWLSLSISVVGAKRNVVISSWFQKWAKWDESALFFIDTWSRLSQCHPSG